MEAPQIERSQRLVVIGTILQLIALLPLFSMAMSIGRMVEKIEAHEKRLDKLEDSRLTSFDKFSKSDTN